MNLIIPVECPSLLSRLQFRSHSLVLCSYGWLDGVQFCLRFVFRFRALVWPVLPHLLPCKFSPLSDRACAWNLGSVSPVNLPDDSFTRHAVPPDRLTPEARQSDHLDTVALLASRGTDSRVIKT